MRRLTGADLFHLTREARGLPAHTIKVAIVAPGDGTLDPDALGPDTLGPDTLLDPDAVAAWAAAVLPRREPFRWRLQHVPLRLGRPVWVDAATIDPAHHVVRHTLEGPDVERAFDRLIGELAGGAPLPRDRPLWRLWVVDGLDGGRVAMVLQLHHSLADGGASVRIWEELLGADDGEPAPQPTRGRRALITHALRHHVRAARDLPSLLKRLRASDAQRSDVASDATPPTNYFECPATSLNGPLSTERDCRFVEVPIERLQRIGRALGGTVNDVFCASCSGAVRQYLLERDELPSESLTATAPVALERDGERYGNVMTSWFWSLATDQADPRARSRAVRDSLRAAKALQDADPRLLYDLQEHRGVYEASFRTLSFLERRRGRPMLNLVTSNVRGPDPLTWQGHPVVAVRSVGPLTGHMGLNVTAWSYDGTFTVGLHADRGLVPDLSRLAALVGSEIDVLEAAADAVDSGRRGPTQAAGQE